jgi:hypothetical protein
MVAVSATLLGGGGSRPKRYLCGHVHSRADGRNGCVLSQCSKKEAEMQEGSNLAPHRRPLRRRWLTLAGLLVLAAALVSPALADGPPTGNPEDLGVVAPVGTLTADPAAKLSVETQPVLNVPSEKPPFHNRPTVDLNTYKAAKKAVTGASRPTAQAPAGPAAPVSLGGFNGITQATAQSTWPSDINGAVSHGGFADGYNVQVVNQHFTAYHKSTAPGAAVCDMSFNTRTGNGVNSLFDPRVEYDQYWQRFVDEVESSGASQHQYLQITTSRNPCGAYFNYDLGGINGFCPAPLGGAKFWDYPQISLTQDAVIVTANCFEGNIYRGALTFAVAKAKIYNGLGFSTPVFGPFCGTTTPPRVIDGNPRAHMLARCGGVQDVQFRNPQADFYGAIASNTTVAGLAPTVPPSAGQIGCFAASCTVDTSDGRYVNPPTQYGDHLWAVATWTLGGLATPFWHDIDTEGAGADTLKQSGVVFISGCGADYNASIGATTAGTAWVNWSQSQAPSCGGGTPIRMAAASRLGGDPVNTMPVLGVVFSSCCELTGNFDPNFGTQRWGDTSSVSVDPSFGDRAWLWNGSAATSAIWGTRSQLVRNP